MLGAGINVAFVIGFTAPPYTNWNGARNNFFLNRTFSSTDTVADYIEKPEPNRYVYAATFYGVFPVIIAARTAFAVASHGPKPLPGHIYHGWRYAMHCFLAMLFFQYLIVTLLYILPMALDVPLESLFLDTLPIAMCAVVAPVLTAVVLNVIASRDFRNHAQEEAETKSTSQSLSCTDIVVNQLNMTFILIVIFACVFFL